MNPPRIVILLLVVFAALLSGCGIDDGPASATLQPTAVATTPPPTVTQTLEPSPSPMPPTLTATPIPSPTPTTRLPDDLLFEQQTADCQLPCWHGLRIGESGPDEIQETVDTVFNLTGRDLFSPESIEISEVFEDLPGFALVWWQKTLNQSPFQGFAMDVWITENDHVLQGLVFHLQNESYTSTTTLEHIIHELGRPDHLLVNGGGDIHDDHAVATIMPVYDRGIAFQIMMYVPILSLEDDVVTFEYCTDAPYPRSPDSTAYLSYSTRVYLTAPFESLASLDTLQQYLIGDEIKNRGLVPIQNIFNVDVEQFLSRIEDNQTVCIQGQRVINYNPDAGG